MILQSLVRQLAWSTDNLSIAKPVKYLYDEAQKSPESGESRLSADECIRLLGQLTPSRQHTRIIIDALDECSEPDELLSSLKEISLSSKGTMQFFFSSRMNVAVSEEFPECTKVEVGSDNQDDIEFYVHTEVKKRKKRLLHGKAPELENQLVEILSRRAQGM